MGRLNGKRNKGKLNRGRGNGLNRQNMSLMTVPGIKRLRLRPRGPPAPRIAIVTCADPRLTNILQMPMQMPMPTWSGTSAL